MAKVTILEDKCKGCGLCVDVCPKKILDFDKTKVNKKGYNPVCCTDENSCIGCAFCATMCPDLVLEIYK